MDANAPAPKPDMLEQAGQLLKAFVNGDEIMQMSPADHSDYRVSDELADSRAVILASAVLAVAAELRDIHNVLHEINQRMESVDSLASMAENVAIWGTGS